MQPPSKKLILALIAVILIFVVIVLLLPERETTPIDAGVILVSDTDTPIGSAQMSYPRWDGSATSEYGMNADGSPMIRGDTICFEVGSWPATVTVCSDLQGREVLTTYIVEEAPEEGCAWQLTVSDGPDGLCMKVESVPQQ